MGHPITAPTTDLRKLEMSLAYERAVTIIESNCPMPEVLDEDQDGWYDLYSGTEAEEIAEACAYLSSRHLLLPHPEHTGWVMICDEGEPVAQPIFPDPIAPEKPALRIREVTPLLTRRGVCRFCGCTDEHACPEGCWWANAEHTICTSDRCLAAWRAEGKVA